MSQKAEHSRLVRITSPARPVRWATMSYRPKRVPVRTAASPAATFARRATVAKEAGQLHLPLADVACWLTLSLDELAL